VYTNGHDEKAVTEIATVQGVKEAGEQVSGHYAAGYARADGGVHVRQFVGRRPVGQHDVHERPPRTGQRAVDGVHGAGHQDRDGRRPRCPRPRR